VGNVSARTLIGARVIRWKKFCGFYRDLAGEHFSAYTIDRNQLDNTECVCPTA
jgi:hypothetical protein